MEKEITTLSAAQRAVLKDIRLQPDDSIYSLWDYIDIPGPIDESALLEAIRIVVRSSDVFGLRVADPSSRVDAVLETPALPIASIDLSEASQADERALAWMREDHARPFDLTTSPLFRMALIRLPEGRIRWYRNFHHVLVDGFSMAVMGAWVADAYRKLIRGERSMPEPRGSWSAFVRSESDYRSSTQHESDTRFWKDVYGDLPDPVTLAQRTVAARRLPARTSTRWLRGELVHSINALAERLGIRLGYALVAAIVLYLHRATAATDIALCIPVHGRTRNELDTLGMAVNTLPVRFQLEATTSVAAALVACCATLQEAHSHGRYRFEELLEQLGLRRDTMPFRIVANVLRAGESWRFGDAPVTVETMNLGPVDDLNILVLESSQRDYLRVTFAYQPALYSDWEIEAHLDYFTHSLRHLVECADQPLANLPLCDAAELRRLVARANDTERELPYCTFHELFDRRAAASPDALALMDADGALTYQGLRSRADQLAIRLRATGVVTGDAIGVCLERGCEWGIAFLGALKAGGVYVPIDPTLPPERIEFVCQDAGVRTILTTTAHQNELPEHVARLIYLDASDGSSPDPEPLLAADSGPEDLAYIIYTSGSTGRPKGCLLQHLALCNLALAQTERFDLRPGERVLQFARIGFDASIAEICATLAAGATLCLSPQNELLGPALAPTLQRWQITNVTLPPVALAWLQPSDVPQLKTVIVAGEQCPTETAARWAQHVRFINAYGPTETTVCATTGVYAGGPQLPIGRPIANMEIHIMDPHGAPCPPAIAGEFVIGGLGVGRGYLNRPEETRARFTVDDSDGIVRRKFFSGDRGRYLPDMSIEFLGRRDDQVKIRGFRVELAEIECALRNESQVQDCAVIAKDFGNQVRLVAYLLAKDRSVDAAHLRRELRAKLPDYMIPVAFLTIPSLPLTRSGKVDRRALRDRPIELPRRAIVGPGNETERRLMDIWSRALNVEVSAHDSFVDLGGDSLALIQIVTEIEECFGLALPPATLYECSSLAQVALAISARLRET